MMPIPIYVYQAIKIKHYTTVIHSESLHAIQGLSLIRTGMDKELKIVGLGIRKWNLEFYFEINQLTDYARNRRVVFYDHVLRMLLSRFINCSFTFWQNKKRKQRG